MTEEYYEGIGCTCAARSDHECCCSEADWTPKEVYELRAEVEGLKTKLIQAEAYMEYLQYKII